MFYERFKSGDSNGYLVSGGFNQVYLGCGEFPKNIESIRKKEQVKTEEKRPKCLESSMVLFKRSLLVGSFFSTLEFNHPYVCRIPI